MWEHTDLGTIIYNQVQKGEEMFGEAHEMLAKVYTFCT